MASLRATATRARFGPRRTCHRIPVGGGLVFVLPVGECPHGNIRAQMRGCSAVAEATPHGGGWPLHADAYHSHPRPARAIDHRVRTDFVAYVSDADLTCDRSEPWKSPERRDAGHPGATTRATIGPKDGCADEFFRERRDRSAPLPGSSRILPLRGPGR